MSERNEDFTPDVEWENANHEAEDDGADVYGDVEVELPPVEDTPYVPEAEGEAAPESAEVAEPGAPANPDPAPDAVVEPTSEPQIVEEAPSAPETVHEPAPTTAAAGIPRRHAEEAGTGDETASDVIPEVETTVVTRRSLLGGAQSSIPTATQSVEEIPAPVDAPATSEVPAPPVPAAEETVAQPVVRRSIGLSHSAAQTEAMPAADPNAAVAAAAGAGAAVAAAETRVQPHIPTRESVREQQVPSVPVENVEELFADSTPASLPSRFAAHAWTFLLALLVLPSAWYLMSDGIAHIALSGTNPWESGTLSWVGLSELLGGALLAGVLIWSARWSTVGVFVSSLVLLIVGLPFLVAPAWTYDLVEPATSALAQWNIFGKAVAHHFLWTGFHGLLAVAGIIGIFVWLAAHGARKHGAKREALSVAIAERNLRTQSASTK
ncbi:hypothetical protein [Boudabousia marimammalium]|uniref:Uncharacterized protein n=1 Tax=Boudabousia marimammalium TaxID=156892 RepID=A0A1Q5PT51_9ACTO|nr:hypothetical protein [Boudabousia marimammalium]OKL50635.1 hypothetical protein BM477_01400 [Boudabousia marimammalium]